GHVPRVGVNGRRAVAFTVEREGAFGRRIVDDAVRSLAGLGGSRFLERLQIEDRDLIGAAVADEAAAGFGGDGDAVYAGRVGNVGHHFVAVRVQHHHVRSARDVEPARGAVD